MKYYVNSISHVALRGTFIALIISCLALFASNAAAITISDNFNDNIPNDTIWGLYLDRGNGILTEINQHLEYTVLTPTAEDASKSPLIGGHMPYDADWETQIDVFNSTNPSQNNQLNSFGIDMYHCEDSNDWLYAELYASHYGGPPKRKGFNAGFATDDGFPEWADVGVLEGTGSVTGSVQIAFDSVTKILGVFYRVG